MVQIVTFTGAFTHAREDRGAAMALGDVVDQFLDENGLAHAGAAEQADLAALGIGGQKVDDLDAGDKDRAFGRLIDELGRLGMDGRAQFGPEPRSARRCR